MNTTPVVYLTQPERIRAHLVAGKSITPGQAMLVYGISRLAAVIEVLRLEGLDIAMVLKQDEGGKKYGEYKLAAPIRIGSRVQVKRGHGLGLPYWVLKTQAAKVVGLVGDVAYVQFDKKGETFETIAMNVKELNHVA